MSDHSAEQTNVMKKAEAVLELVAIRDEDGAVQPRGKVVRLGPGRVVFYRDVTGAQLVRTIGGYAIEVGLLAFLASRRVFRVHYRVENGPLLTTDLETFNERGAPWDKNGRAQLVLPVGRWTSYSAELAYWVPREEMPWTVVDHRTGAVVTKRTEGDETPSYPEQHEEDAAARSPEQDRHRVAAELAMKRIAVLMERDPKKLDQDWLAVAVVLTYLMRADDEARAGWPAGAGS